MHLEALEVRSYRPRAQNFVSKQEPLEQKGMGDLLKDRNAGDWYPIVLVLLFA